MKAAPSLHSQAPWPHGIMTESWVGEGAAFKALSKARVRPIKAQPGDEVSPP